MRSCGSSSSPTAHITFCTLTEVFRPQILIMAPPLPARDGRLVVATNSSLRRGKKQDAPGARAAAANTFKLQNSLFGTIQNNGNTAGERFPHSKVALDSSATLVNTLFWKILVTRVNGKSEARRNYPSYGRHARPRTKVSPAGALLRAA